MQIQISKARHDMYRNDSPLTQNSTFKNLSEEKYKTSTQKIGTARVQCTPSLKNMEKT